MSVKTCQVIQWDCEWRVSAFVIESGRDDGLRTVFSAHGSPAGSFVEQLTEVHRQLKSHKADVIVVGGAIPDAYWFELTLPPAPLRELGNVLEFELPRQLPGAPEELAWFYRLLETSARSRVRVFCCPQNRWREVSAALGEAGIDFDAYCHAFTAVETKHDGQLLFLPDQQPGMVWNKAEGEPVALRELRMADADCPATEHPELLIAEYALTERFWRDRRYLSDQPASMRPQRLQGLKLVVIALGILVPVLLGMLWYRHYDDRRGRENAIAQELEDIEYALIAQQEGMEKLLLAGESAQKLLAAVAEIDPAETMAALSEKLPPHAWITSFRYSGNKVALSLAIKGETDSIVETLNNGIRAMAVESLRQQLNNDGSTTMTVTLQKSVEAAP